VAICAQKGDVVDLGLRPRRQFGHRFGVVAFDETVTQNSIDRHEVEATYDAEDATVLLHGSMLGHLAKPSTSFARAVQAVQNATLGKLVLFGVVPRRAPQPRPAHEVAQRNGWLLRMPLRTDHPELSIAAAGRTARRAGQVARRGLAGAKGATRF
jgi:hypothetical protein